MLSIVTVVVQMDAKAALLFSPHKFPFFCTTVAGVDHLDYTNLQGNSWPDLRRSAPTLHKSYR